MLRRLATGGHPLRLGAAIAAAATSVVLTLRHVLTVGAAIDAADLAASVRQVRAGTLSAHGIVGVAVGAAAFTTCGVAALRTLEGGTAHGLE